MHKHTNNQKHTKLGIHTNKPNPPGNKKLTILIGLFLKTFHFVKQMHKA